MKRFFHIQKKSVIALIFNGLGLVIAFVSFILIMMGVYSELNYDKFYLKAEHIYRVENSRDDNIYYPYEADLIRAAEITSVFPDVENYFLIGSTNQQVFICEDKFSGRNTFNQNITLVSSSIVDGIDFHMVEGSESCLAEQSTVLIPQSLASKIFGKTFVCNKVLQTRNSRGQMYNIKIGGVYKDFPRNSIIKNNIYSLIPEDKFGTLFLVLHPQVVQNRMQESIRKESHVFQDYDKNAKYRLNKLPDIYFTSDMGIGDDIQYGNKTSLYIFITIAILILFVATINFINFTIALIPSQIKSVNTKKILGCPVTILRLDVIGRSVLMALFTFVLALGVVYSFVKLNISDYFYTDVIFVDLRAILWAALGALLIGIVAGVYPAFYSTLYPTSLLLKGTFSLSSKGRWFRTLLVGFQFTISIVLIIVSCFMNIQYRFMKNQNMGFQNDRLLELQTMRFIAPQTLEALRLILLQNPNIKDITICDSPIFAYDGLSSRFNGEIQIDALNVVSNFTSLLGIKIIEGRDFNQQDDVRESAIKVIINRKAQLAYNLKVGDVFDGIEVIGIMENFYAKSLHWNIDPLALFNFGNRKDVPIIYVKLNTTDYQSVIRFIKENMSNLNPYLVQDISVVDDIISFSYRNDLKRTQLITLYSIVSILISLIGVFGLVFFETGYRRKEIGVRRVMGATVQEVLLMFNRSYVKIVVVCFVLAAPVAYYATKQWLNSFAYKTPMYFWVFLLALFVVLLITILTVTFQSYRAATENPVDSIKTE